MIRFGSLLADAQAALDWHCDQLDKYHEYYCEEVREQGDANNRKFYLFFVENRMKRDLVWHYRQKIRTQDGEKPYFAEINVKKYLSPEFYKFFDAPAWEKELVLETERELEKLRQKIDTLESICLALRKELEIDLDPTDRTLH